MQQTIDPSQLDPVAFNAYYQDRYSRDFRLFAIDLTIPSASGPQRFKDCMAPFQSEAFDLLAPSLLAVRDGTMPPRRRFWIERTKKAGKDSDLAICLLWLMAYPKRPILVQVSADCQLQAGIIKRRIADLLFYNRWLHERVRTVVNRIVGYDSVGEVIIESTSTGEAKQGATPDLLVLNELVHVDRWGVNETHMNNADGVPQGVVIISTNAGIKGTPAHRWRRLAVENPSRWTTLVWNGRTPWLDQKDIEDARRRDPVGAEFDRLWLGKWISGVGGALSENEINGCFTLMELPDKPERGWVYLAGLDLGISHDHSGVAVVGLNPATGMMKVVHIEGVAPSVPNDQGQLEVDGSYVEQLCYGLWKRWRIVYFGFDPAAGGSFMAQSLRNKDVPMKEMTFASKVNQNEMALALVKTVKAGRLQCYEDPEGRLRRDFGKFAIENVTGGGYKLVAVSDEWGHADVGVALMICLPYALKLLGGLGGWYGDEEETEVVDDYKPLTKEELEDMPKHLREIYDFYGEKPKHVKWRGQRDEDDVEWDERISKL